MSTRLLSETSGPGKPPSPSITTSGGQSGKPTLESTYGTRHTREVLESECLDRVRAKFWLCTLNNPTPQEHDALRAYFGDSTNGAYATWQLERGESGTLHIQAFFGMATVLSRPKLKTLLQSKRWFLIRARWPVFAREYVRKEDTRVEGPWELGTQPVLEQGKRSDIDDEICDVIQGLHPKRRKFAEAHPKGIVIRERGLIALWNTLHQSVRSTRPKVTIFWGESGSGKSYKASLMLPEHETYWKAPGKWWCGYWGQKHTVLNEFSPKAWDFTWNQWKRITDWCPMTVEPKNGNTHFTSEYLTITTNEDPKDWWYEERLKPLEAEVWNNRDIKCIQMFKKDLVILENIHIN